VLHRVLNKVRRAYAQGGLRHVFRVAYNRLRVGRWQVDPHPASPFDVRWGTSTEDLVDQLDLETDAPNWPHAIRYQPSEAGVLEALVAETGIDPRGWVFVDLGSGKGRQVMEAVLLGFRAAVGVEFSKTLHQLALRNLDAFCRRGGPDAITLLHADAAGYTLPPGPVVVYLYNPFGPPVMRRVAAHAKAHGPPLWVWYHSPVHPACWDEAGLPRAPGGETVRCQVWHWPEPYGE
jgi:hypothetical protein